MYTYAQPAGEILIATISSAGGFEIEGDLNPSEDGTTLIPDAPTNGDILYMAVLEILGARIAVSR